MSLDADALGRLLCDRLPAEVRIDQRPDGALMLRTPFEFPDGDRFPIQVSESASGSLRLSDRGHTLMHVSCEHGVDSLLDGTRGRILERIMGETGLCWDGDRGVLCLDTAPEHLPAAIFAFGQALTRVCELTLLPRSGVGSTFHDDLADLLRACLDEARIERDYRPSVPNAEFYPVDYRIEGGNDVPLLLYGVPDRDKARLVTIMLAHFHRHDLRLESLVVFADQAAIPRTDLARLSDVGGEMISSLASHADFHRKLLQRVAA